MPDPLTKEFWGAVFKGDLKGAINAYKNEATRIIDVIKDSSIAQNYRETNKPILDAYEKNGISGLPQGFCNQLESAVQSFKDQCGDYFDPCDTQSQSPTPSHGVDTTHLQQNKEDPLSR